MTNVAKIREGMPVVALDGRDIGRVSAVGDWRLVVTTMKEGRAFEHLIPLAWVESADRYVFLNKGSRFVAANWDAPLPVGKAQAKSKAA